MMIIISISAMVTARVGGAIIAFLDSGSFIQACYMFS